MRRLRKSTDVRQLMSLELMLKIFQEDKAENTSAKSGNDNSSNEKSKQVFISGQRETLQNTKIEQQVCFTYKCKQVRSILNRK